MLARHEPTVQIGGIDGHGIGVLGPATGPEAVACPRSSSSPIPLSSFPVKLLQESVSGDLPIYGTRIGKGFEENRPGCMSPRVSELCSILGNRRHTPSGWPEEKAEHIPRF